LTDVTVATTYNAVAGQSTGAQVLATFTDGNPDALATNYKATVSWVGALTGKATVSVQLVSRTVTLSTWNVLGSATYSKAGAYTIKVTVADAGGKSLNTSKTTFKVSGPQSAPQRAPQRAPQSAGRVAATAAVLSVAASPARPSGRPAHAVNDAALAALVGEWTTSSRSSPAADASKDAGKGLAELPAGMGRQAGGHEALHFGGHVQPARWANCSTMPSRVAKSGDSMRHTMPPSTARPSALQAWSIPTISN
ncbi:MAG: hypothetical protein ABSF26_25130, partial [Thermoguttaceae bacterium]